MIATITRTTFTDKSTIGILDLDAVFEAYTLEPAPPHLIPAGTYPMRMIWSDRFQRVTPHVLNVPGFTAIEWHNGNYPGNTEGCTLVGQTRGIDFVGNSDDALDALIPKLPMDFTVTYFDQPMEAT